MAYIFKSITSNFKTYNQLRTKVIIWYVQKQVIIAVATHLPRMQTRAKPNTPTSSLITIDSDLEINCNSHIHKIIAISRRERTRNSEEGMTDE